MTMNELYLSKGYYNLCLAILMQAKKDAKIRKYEYDVYRFFNNSYVFDLCRDYIELYRDREVELYKFKLVEQLGITARASIH